MKKTFYILIAAAILIFSGNFIYSNYNKWGQKVQPVNINGTVIKKPKNITSFNLNRGNNQTLSDMDLQNKWTLIFFGYTTCPDICPTTLSTLSTMYKTLDNLPKKHMPQVLFVSIDPEHDYDGQADKYVKYFNSNFIGLTGSKTQLADLQSNLGVVAQKVMLDNNDGGQNYIYDHSSTIYVVNPQGQLQAILSAPHKADNLAKDYRAIINKFG